MDIDRQHDLALIADYDADRRCVPDASDGDLGHEINIHKPTGQLFHANRMPTIFALTPWSTGDLRYVPLKEIVLALLPNRRRLFDCTRFVGADPHGSGLIYLARTTIRRRPKFEIPHGSTTGLRAQGIEL